MINGGIGSGAENTSVDLRKRIEVHVFNFVMAAIAQIAFSHGGEYLGFSSPDGRLKIWESSTGSLKQEYTPSSHLSTTCTCLCWGPGKHSRTSSHRKKKRKSDAVTETIKDLELLAIGTCSGTILLYSVVKADLHSQMNGGHSQQVNAICWNADSDSMYSCSDDLHIIEWSIRSSSVKRKWKGGSSSIYSLCISPDGKALISGSRTISWWDVKSEKLIKKFTGHATEVQKLHFIPYPDSPSENSYVVSSAVGDRLINAWHLNSESANSNALASFLLPEEPTYLDVSHPSSREESVLLAATTKSGTLYIFEHHLNGHCKKPLKPSLTIAIASSGSKEIPKPIPIICAQILIDTARNIQLVYGSFLKLTFEKLPYSTKEPEVFLLRENPCSFTLSTENSSSKIKTPITGGDVKVLVAGNALPASSSETNTLSRKRKKESSSSKQLPMEERLSALSLEQPSGSEPPRLDNLAHLLVQGLQSSDKQILTNVLTRNEDAVILNTVPRLPVQTVIPLLKELEIRIHNRATPNHAYLKWLRCILSTHTSYLMTCPNLEALLGPIYQMLDSRTQIYEKMSKLKGRMDLILTQVLTRKSDSRPEISTESLLVYQDDSSDEAEDGLAEFMQSHSESEDWEDLSVIDSDDFDADTNALREKEVDDDSMDENDEHLDLNSDDESIEV